MSVATPNEKTQLKGIDVLKNIYHKYMVKSHTLFVVIVILFIALFLFLSLSIKVSIIETLDGTSGDDKLIINQMVYYPINKVYVYQDRSKRIVPYDVLGIEYVDETYTVVFIDNIVGAEGFEGVIKIDVEKEQVSLLSVIFGFNKRYVESNLK